MGRREEILESEDQTTQYGLVGLLAVRLRGWRKEKEIPLKQVASDLGVSIAVVSAWERGSRFPSASHLEKISAYTGIPVWRLFYPGPAEKQEIILR